jgi:uncharacterized protein YjdB
MRNRLFMGALSVIGVALSLTGCTNPSGLDSIAITPATQSLAVAQTAQLSVTGTYGNANHLSTQPVSSGVTWASNTPSVATVSTTGVVTGVGAGTATITATAQGFKGPVTATSTVTVGAAGGTGGGGGTGGSLVSIAVIPGSQSVSGAGQTTQFIAIGTTSTGATQYLTNAVTWSSSTPAVATIGAATGLASAVGAGTTTITALYTNTQTGSVVTGVATLTVSAGASEQFTALSLTPSGETVAVGQTTQLIALGTAGSTGLSQVITGQVAWTSSIPTIATVGATTGLVTGVSAGSTTITAIFTNADKSVATASATITVSSTPAPEPILSLSIVPSSLSVNTLEATGQFLAIATYSTAPYVKDVTNDPKTTWISSFPNDFPVGTNSGGNSGASAGLVTAYASGGATIIAESASTDGTIETATATFNCPLALPNPNGDPPTAGSCYSGKTDPLLATVTVYAQGLNTTNWLITAPSATGTPDVIHCGPGWAANGGAGGSVCTATYPLNTTVTLTAPAQAGVAFGGWSSSCAVQNPNPPVANGQNQCTLQLNSVNGSDYDVTVSAVFN